MMFAPKSSKTSWKNNKRHGVIYAILPRRSSSDSITGCGSCPSSKKKLLPHHLQDLDASKRTFIDPALDASNRTCIESVLDASNRTFNDSTEEFSLSVLSTPIPLQVEEKGVKNDDAYSHSRSETQNNEPSSVGAIVTPVVTVDLKDPLPRPQQRESKKVMFPSVEIRSYPICAGDNPAVPSGIPLSLGWDYELQGSLLLDEYEQHKENPRSLAELKTTSLQRLEMLRRSCGYSRGEILQAIRLVNESRRLRERTTKMLLFESIEERLERTKRAFLNQTFRRKEKQMERAYLQCYYSNN